MNAAWIRKAAAVPVRQLHLAGAGVLLVACAALWFYVLRAPLVQLRTVRAEHARLALANDDPRLLGAQLAAIAADSAARARRSGDAPAGPAAPPVVQLIADIGHLAARHRVTLRAASPLAEVKTLGFEQYGIEADASGRYADLLAWLTSVEQAGTNLAIDAFEMRPGETPGQVQIKLRIAGYRPMGPTS